MNVSVEIFLAWEWGTWTTEFVNMPREVYEACITLDGDGNTISDEEQIMTWVDENTELLDNAGLIHCHVHWVNEEPDEEDM